ncbi:hypothetical protein ACFFYR_38500 [Paraburkholderia dipogonis]|uniref:hypothetical protein n=1 Tax=Paraburkholderia dipogonis TaxID=1211383 RepID=UPI0035ECB7BB
MVFTDYYGEQSCTAGRAPRSSRDSAACAQRLTKVGLPGAPLGMRAEDPNIPEFASKSLGYSTGQFGEETTLGDRDATSSTMHGFDEFFGNLYHLNAEEDTGIDATIPHARDFLIFARNNGPARCVALLVGR